MKYTIKFTTRFKRDYKLAMKRGCEEARLRTVVEMLANGMPLPAEYRDHQLTGNYNGCRECHLRPDWLLIYKVFENVLVLELTRTGTHSDLFRA